MPVGRDKNLTGPNIRSLNGHSSNDEGAVSGAFGPFGRLR
jgi:hypothetical protein